jgi:hypothetical protein
MTADGSILIALHQVTQHVDAPVLIVPPERAR